MVKYDLREQGFSSVEKIPKQSIITLIWAGLTLLMIAGTFGSAIFFETSDNKFIDFFVDTADYICEDIFKSSSAVTIIYLVIWILIGLTLYFIIKNDLRGKKPFAVMRAILILFSVVGAFAFMLTVGRTVSAMRSRGGGIPDYGFDAVVADPSDAVSLVGYIITFIFALALYLAVKFIVTIWVCSDRLNSIKLKVLGKGIPVCSCKEALKLWQTVVIYLVPVVFVYSYCTAKICRT